MNSYCVYEHLFPNGKRYIGITSTEPETRWRCGEGYKTQKKIANAIKHFGWNNIQHNVIADNLTKEQAASLEEYLIATLDTIESGYNDAIGGDNINTCYLNAHILYMLRESRIIDEQYGIVESSDTIMAAVDSVRFNQKVAEAFNYYDFLIESQYDEYKKYSGAHPFYDFHAVRVDCYWWTMLRLIENNLPQSKGETPYWDNLIKDLGLFKEEEQTNGKN
jgi:hypothetical protein